MDDELDTILSGIAKAQFDLSQQLGRRTMRPSASSAEVELEEIFMEQEVANTSTTIKWEADVGPLPLEDDESLAMSSLSSQLSNAAAHPGYPFWQYQHTIHRAPIMLPNTFPQWGIPQQADYVALNIERHNGEPMVYSTIGGGAPIYCNVLHTKLWPEIPLEDDGDDLYLLGECFQMDYVMTQAIEAIEDAGVMANIYRLHHYGERKWEIQWEHQWLSHLMDFLTSEWQWHYVEEKRVRAQEEAMIKRLIVTRVTKHIKPFIHFNDKHTYLSWSHMHNDILWSGWNKLEQNYEMDVTQPRLTAYGSWEALEQCTAPDTGPITPQTSPSAAGLDRSSKLQAFAAHRRSSCCKYCTVCRHFVKECTVPHWLCHCIGGNCYSVPKTHSHCCPVKWPICPYVGFHSVTLYR